MLCKGSKYVRYVDIQSDVFTYSVKAPYLIETGSYLVNGKISWLKQKIILKMIRTFYINKDSFCLWATETQNNSNLNKIEVYLSNESLAVGDPRTTLAFQNIRKWNRHLCLFTQAPVTFSPNSSSSNHAYIAREKKQTREKRLTHIRGYFSKVAYTIFPLILSSEMVNW